VVRFPEKEHRTVDAGALGDRAHDPGVHRGGHHGQDDPDADGGLDAPGAVLGDRGGQDRHDRVGDGALDVGDDRVEADHGLDHRVEREFEGVVRRVADDPAAQEQVAVQEVECLQRVVRGVRVAQRGA
jgi:hypothetical protein